MCISHVSLIARECWLQCRVGALDRVLYTQKVPILLESIWRDSYSLRVLMDSWILVLCYGSRED